MKAMKANWKYLASALALTVLTAMPSQAVAAVKNVMCVKTNTGQYFPVVRISMMVIPDGGSTFEIVLKDGEGEANVESVSFEKHEADIDFSKYSGTSYDGAPTIDMTKKCYLLTSTGKYWTVSQMPQLTAKDGSSKFDVTVGSATETDVESVWFYRGDDVENALGIEGMLMNDTEERLQLQTPVSSQLYISGCGTASQAQLYSMDGKQRDAAAVVNGATTIYVGNLTPGVYIIKVGKKSLKFIKK